MSVIAAAVGFIPSPGGGAINIGPLTVHAYGLFIGLGVVAAVWLAERRWRARGGRPGQVSDLALWAVPAGLIGARMYHVATDNQLYRHNWLGAFKVWDGGLGIWGAVAGGVVAAVIFAWRKGLSATMFMDVAAPALPLAQAIGRWGNYMNQELFGRPTHLPWALKIDAAHRPVGYERFSTFHPTFLYESLWDLVVVALLIVVIERRLRLRPGRLFAWYVALYSFGRFFTEWLRIDPAHRMLGLRLNDWTSIALFAAASSFLVWDALTHRGEGSEPRDAEVSAPGSVDDQPSSRNT
jgi:prolipoprotein diacylglyceryl transferase